MKQPKKITSALVNFTESERIGRGRFRYVEYREVAVCYEESDNMVYIPEVGHKKRIAGLRHTFWLNGAYTKEELIEERDRRAKKLERELAKGRLADLRAARDHLGKKRVDRETREYAGLVNETRAGFGGLGFALADCLRSFGEIHKSPYSESFYDTSDVSWGHKPEGSLRLSDHWNFESCGARHCVIRGSDGQYIGGHWLLCRYENGYYVIVEDFDPSSEITLDLVKGVGCAKQELQEVM